MALLKRELHRQVKGPEITHADRCTLVFDTDTKRLYVESEVAHLEAKVGGTVEYQTTTMDIADYLTQGGQTAGQRELWRLLRALFHENSDSAEYTDETSPAASRHKCLSVQPPRKQAFSPPPLTGVSGGMPMCKPTGRIAVEGFA